MALILSQPMLQKKLKELESKGLTPSDEHLRLSSTLLGMAQAHKIHNSTLLHH